VQEITVDGDVVFSAQQLPVAYQNLVAWYPFDSAEYGGSNADDVTAIIGGSGDDTAYDATVSATHQPSGGIYDINGGPNSGGFDFNGSNDDMETSGSHAAETIMMWVNFDFTLNSSSSPRALIFESGTSNGVYLGSVTSGLSGEVVTVSNPGGRSGYGGTYNSGEWYHFAFTNNAGDFFVDGDPASSIGTNSGGAGPLGPGPFTVAYKTSGNPIFVDGQLDDLRFYDTILSQSEIEQVYDNTKPPSKP
jgi:MSHA biogenesis protein MshQ